MRLSLLAQHAAVCCSLALPVAVFGQASYVGGGENAIAGALVGDQVRPSVSLNASGGFLVWQDNATCLYGLGISALALDNNFHGVGAHFRVNKVGFGDDEHPQVALLNNGGAVFVWQGGPQGFQHIYARFMSPTNTWLANDTLVNSATNRFQANPAVVCLAGGNIAIVWSSYNQANSTSMQDVFCQLFTPTGQKVGGEFLVNQFTSFNQRSPAITALSSGGFLVAWVSELQRSDYRDNPSSAFLYSSPGSSLPSVDIYARSFDANGSPQGDEFLVNTSSNVCDHPSLATASDGSFVVTWAERSSQLKATGWDVFARPFSNAGNGGSVAGVNTFTTGDQNAAQISVLGTNYLVVWTSMGQDGASVGLYGQFLLSDGSHSGTEFRVNVTNIVGRQIQPAVASDGVGQFLPVWDSYSAPSHSVDLFARDYSIPGFVPAPPTQHYGPPPAETFIDIPPSSVNGSPPATSVPSAITLVFPPSSSSPALDNPFLSSQGTYNGLFYDPNGVSATSAGYFSAKVTARHAYSAKLMLGGRSYSVSGAFDTNGLAAKRVRRSGGLSNLSVQLQLVRLDAAGGSQIRGSVTNQQWSAVLLADRLVFNQSSSLATAYKGSYTMNLPPGDGGPDGSGFGTMKVSAGGLVTWSGTLADGSKVSQGSALSEQGYWPLYASLYRGSGLMASWVQFSQGDAGGSAVWSKPRGAVAAYFLGAFTNQVNVVGSVYTPGSVSVLSALHASDLSFSGGALSQPVAQALALDARGRVVSTGVAAASQPKLRISLSTGLFKGTATLSPGPGKVSFQGVILGNGASGTGFFYDNVNRLSGQLDWDPSL
jgi:hypothetical protein